MSTSRPPSTILIVDDDPAIRETLGMVLQDESYATASAVNGEEALDYLQHTQPPCLILLDLVMPLMDGWKFRKAQLFDPFLEFIPVVLLSADARVQEHAATLRTAGFLVKPLEPRHLFEMARTH
jgi:CheY-like chemotaxis protein